jgi:hypothetical protein
MTAGILGGLGGAFGGAGAGAGAGAAAGAGGGFTLPPAPQIGSSPFAGFTF